TPNAGGRSTPDSANKYRPCNVARVHPGWPSDPCNSCSFDAVSAPGRIPLDWPLNGARSPAVAGSIHTTTTNAAPRRFSVLRFMFVEYRIIDIVVLIVLKCQITVIGALRNTFRIPA